jgi:hypothetical protein
MEYYILMADIISSSKKNANLLMEQFKDVISKVNNLQNKNLFSPLTITLGDEFQGVVKNLENSIEVIFMIEESILESSYDIKLRYVLNYGEIETKINSNIAHEMLGSGLTNTRKRLNVLKNEDFRFLILLDEKRNRLQERLNKSFVLYQSFIDSWKLKDYKIASEFLKNEDYKIVAEKVNLDKSSAWRRKISLHINEYFTIKNLIQDLTQNANDN